MICYAYFKSEREIADPQRVKIRKIFLHLDLPRNDRKSDFRAYIWKYFGEKKHVDIEKNDMDLIVYIHPGKCM